MTLKVLQITDCHFVRPEQEVLGVGTAASLTSVLAQALAEGVPDAVVVSGDVGHECAEADYRLFHKMLTDYVDAPTLCLPGNHDVLAAMEAAELPLEPLELGSWQIVALDSHEDLLPEASISPMKMAVVAAAKAGSAARHGLLATHHPLTEVGAPWLDKDRIQDPHGVLDEIARMLGPRLRGAIFGHAHQAVEAWFEDIPLLGTPSTCFQFKPQSATFELDDLGPGYRWLKLADDGSISSEAVWLTGSEAPAI